MLSISCASSLCSSSSSVPFKELEIPQVLKDLQCSNHLHWDLLLCFMYSLKYQISRWCLLLSSQSIVERAADHPCQGFLLTLSLNGLFKHLPSGCKTGVRPPGITATSIFHGLRSAFTSSVKWAWNETHTNSDCSLRGVRGKHWRIHSFTPSSSIHSFLWKETQRDSETMRSLRRRTPLKMILGGSFVPSAATASVTVKLRFNCSAAFYRNGSAACELQRMHWRKFKVHQCLIHVVDSG